MGFPDFTLCYVLNICGALRLYSLQPTAVGDRLAFAKTSSVSEPQLVPEQACSVPTPPVERTPYFRGRD
eukprot:scaffold89861_cov75-Phaeocystis_antarctica.AAC.6